MKIFKIKILWTILFYGWLLLIYILTSSSLPGETPETAFGFRLDYLEHFIVYFFIPVLYYISQGAYLEKIFKDAYYVFLLGILFAILTEIQQYYIEGRAFNPVDLVLNVLGFLSGIPAGRKIRKVFFKASENNPDSQNNPEF